MSSNQSATTSAATRETFDTCNFALAQALVAKRFQIVGLRTHGSLKVFEFRERPGLLKNLMAFYQTYSAAYDHLRLDMDMVKKR
ncbi:MAG: hypothetical protein ACLP1D_07515 [Xanthobacteraceae bacterium]